VIQHDIFIWFGQVTSNYITSQNMFNLMQCDTSAITESQNHRITE